MPLQVVHAAKTRRRTAGGQPAASIADHAPVANIAPFGALVTDA